MVAGIKMINFGDSFDIIEYPWLFFANVRLTETAVFDTAHI